MADEQKMKKIMLTSSEVNGTTRGGVNGVQIAIPHNKTVEVTEAEYEVLQNADLGTAKLVDVNDDDDATGEVKNLSAEAGAKEGTEASPLQAPATPAATSSESNPLMEGEEGDPAQRGGDVVLDEHSDDEGEGEPTEVKPAGNKPAGRAKGAGSTKAKAKEGGKA